MCGWCLIGCDEGNTSGHASQRACSAAPHQVCLATRCSVGRLQHFIIPTTLCDTAWCSPHAERCHTTSAAHDGNVGTAESRLREQAWQALVPWRAYWTIQRTSRLRRLPPGVWQGTWRVLGSDVERHHANGVVELSLPAHGHTTTCAMLAGDLSTDTSGLDLGTSLSGAKEDPASSSRAGA